MNNDEVYFYLKSSYFMKFKYLKNYLERMKKLILLFSLIAVKKSLLIHYAILKLIYILSISFWEFNFTFPIVLILI